MSCAEKGEEIRLNGMCRRREHLRKHTWTIDKAHVSHEVHRSSARCARRAILLTRFVRAIARRPRAFGALINLGVGISQPNRNVTHQLRRMLHRLDARNGFHHCTLSVRHVADRTCNGMSVRRALQTRRLDERGKKKKKEKKRLSLTNVDRGLARDDLDRERRQLGHVQRGQVLFSQMAGAIALTIAGIE